MPIYEYRCENGHNFEVTQRMTDDPVATCQECGAPVQRVFHPVAVHFKGSGFYNTDYGKQRRGRDAGDTAEKEKGASSTTHSEASGSTTETKSSSKTGESSSAGGAGSGSGSSDGPSK